LKPIQFFWVALIFGITFYKKMFFFVFLLGLALISIFEPQ
jgi:hypothetical protein